MKNVRIVSAGELTDAQLEGWAALQERIPELRGPYFRPEFTLAVAAIRSSVRVAVISFADGRSGFFPFERRWRGVGGPVGGCLSDFHGVIAPLDAPVKATGLIQACGLKAWHFDHLPISQVAFADFAWKTCESPFLDLSGGFEAYAAERRQSGSKRLKRVAGRVRRLEEAFGPLRLVPQDEEPSALAHLFDWKSAQYRRTGQPDLLAIPWIRSVLERVLATQGDRFCGMLSSLYAGERLVAVDLGLRSGDVLHSWFPAFDRELADYWPGHVLSIEIARAAASLGIRRIEWGKGDEDYKRSFMSGATLVAEGAVDLRPVSSRLRLAWSRLREPLRSSALRKPLLGPARFFRRVAARFTM